MRRIILLFFTSLTLTMILIPTVIAWLWGEPSKAEESHLLISKIELAVDEKSIPVKVYRNKTKQVEVYPMEEYVRGVLAAEMPINFELEALKAQALAARTYIVKRLLDKDFSDMPKETGDAVVLDTVMHQVFISDQELKDRWGIRYDEYISKLNQAINETRGQVIVYNNYPITAAFFSTSNGYTENSEEYWGMAVPYLRSVESPWDTESPKFNTTVKIPMSTIKAKLNVDTAMATSTGQEWLKTLETTEGFNIKKIKIGDKTFTGREVREKLELNSSSFTWKIEKDGILFTTKGYGHGVGMSQYGANGMAKEGKIAEEIVSHYYQGTTIKDYRDWVK